MIGASEPGRTRAAVVPAPGPGSREWMAVFLLLLGGLAFALGWVVGLVLLWSSTRWTRCEKLIGSLVLPGGLVGSYLLFALGAMVLGTTETCSGSSDGAGRIVQHCVEEGLGTNAVVSAVGGLLLILLALSPLATAVFLVRRATRAGTPAAT